MGEENVFENHQGTSYFLRMHVPAVLQLASGKGAQLAFTDEPREHFSTPAEILKFFKNLLRCHKESCPGDFSYGCPLKNF